MEEEIEELMIEALGLDDGPKLESEIDLMEWFAEMDEDDWSDLFEYTSETDVDTGCGSAGYDVYGSDGPRERGGEELMMSPPMQPNGGGGGNDDTCPDYPNFPSFWDCYAHFRNYEGHGWGDYYYSPSAAEQECHQLCYGTPPTEETETLDEDFWDCLGIEESLATVACVLSAISIIVAASAVTGGGAIVVVFYVGIVGAGVGCGLALYDILQCL